MYAWYRDSAKCYAFLDDVIKTGPFLSTVELRSTRWVRRGWTLQELLPTPEVHFFDSEWSYGGSRNSMFAQLEAATGIDASALVTDGKRWTGFNRYSIAQRMSWASTRETTRPEDIAYCLLGIFDAHMPLLYGEGGPKAFYRLQEEIMKHTTDLSILAWDFKPTRPGLNVFGCLAPSPAFFENSGRIVRFRTDDNPFQLTNKGLSIQVPFSSNRNGPDKIALHNCRYSGDVENVMGLRLVRYGSTYFRHANSLITVSTQHWEHRLLKYALRWKMPRKSIFLVADPGHMAFHAAQ